MQKYYYQSGKVASGKLVLMKHNSKKEKKNERKTEKEKKIEEKKRKPSDKVYVVKIVSSLGFKSL